MAKLSRMERQEALFGYAMTLPGVLLMVGLIIGPLGYAVWLSFHQVNFLFPGTPFIGFENYADVLADEAFWASMWRTLYFVFVSIIVQVTLGLVIAEVLHQAFPGRFLVRVLVILPWAVPTIVNGNLWRWIFDGSAGALNHLLMQIGLIETEIIWLGDPFLALNAIIFADTWRMLPLYVILFMAGRAAISEELYEVASIDGANAWQKFVKITVPLQKPVILVVVILRTVWTLRVFDIIFAMTRGGPANGTMTVTFLAYFETFKFQNFGYGSALAVMIGLTTLALALIYIRLLGAPQGNDQ